MARKIILAVAGSGKTYRICHGLNPVKKNLILAFTHENVHNINRELASLPNGFPSLTDVMTFDSFVYRFCVLPFLPSIVEYFKYTDRMPCGVSLNEPPERSIRKRDQNGDVFYVPNKLYHKDTSLLHYIDSMRRFYCATLCELVLKTGKGKNKLMRKVCDNINRCYHMVLIDEFQDFRLQEFDFLLEFAKRLKSVILVGDYYQHSVSGMNNSGKPYMVKKSEIGYDGFIRLLKDKKFEVETQELNASRRCGEGVCDFVYEKLGIAMFSQGVHQGVVKAVCDDDVDGVLSDTTIVKLVWENAAGQSFKPCVNWSYSKGDTYSSVCVILTNETRKLMDEDFHIPPDCAVRRNKLYVALTRSTGDVYVMRPEQIKAWNARNEKSVV